MVGIFVALLVMEERSLHSLCIVLNVILSCYDFDNATHNIVTMTMILIFLPLAVPRDFKISKALEGV